MVKMGLEHPRVVHLIGMVARENHHMIRTFVLQDEEVLENGVAGSGVPTVGEHPLGGDEVDEFAKVIGKPLSPGAAHMPGEAGGGVLGEQVNPPQPGVDAVAEGEINHAVDAAEAYPRLGPAAGQRMEPLPLSPGQQHHQDPWQTMREESTTHTTGAPRVAWAAAGPGFPVPVRWWCAIHRGRWSW